MSVKSQGCKKYRPTLSQHDGVREIGIDAFVGPRPTDKFESTGGLPRKGANKRRWGAHLPRVRGRPYLGRKSLKRGLLHLTSHTQLFLCPKSDWPPAAAPAGDWQRRRPEGQPRSAGIDDFGAVLAEGRFFFRFTGSKKENLDPTKRRVVRCHAPHTVQKYVTVHL